MNRILQLAGIVTEAKTFVKLPNTKAGVIAMFQDPKQVKKELADKTDITNCKITPNRTEEAKWHVFNPKTKKRIDVFLGGYEDANGDIRPFNDFEKLNEDLIAEAKSDGTKNGAINMVMSLSRKLVDCNEKEFRAALKMAYEAGFDDGLKDGFADGARSASK